MCNTHTLEAANQNLKHLLKRTPAGERINSGTLSNEGGGRSRLGACVGGSLPRRAPHEEVAEQLDGVQPNRLALRRQQLEHHPDHNT